MLTPYDEFPVHQSSRPFSELPVTDLSWDDGYFFGVYSADAETFLFTGLRLSPNSDVVGAYAGVNVAGRQRTLRLSRILRPDYDMAVGPLRYEVVEPLRHVRLLLDDNDSGLRFAIDWMALAEPYLEAHHLATSRGRRTTDQTRYVQCGAPSGWIELDGCRQEVGAGWFASRDHSWGLYTPRKPLADPSDYLPPPEAGGRQRALRFWMPFQTDTHVGFLHFHEDRHGGGQGLDDVFGTPFEGWVDAGDERIALADVDHNLSFMAGTRALAAGTLVLTDERGGKWRQDLELATPPWFPATIGYHQGTWRDGGTISTYHGVADGAYAESDDFDFADQPFEHTFYGGFTVPGLHGMEHLVRVTSTMPDGTVGTGLAQVELFIEGPYEPYGFD